MRLAPFGVTFLVLAKHEAKSDAGLPVAVVAELMHSDQLGLSVDVLAVCRNRNRKRGGGENCGY